ncbi:MAG: TonB C-terminal domain-containing protein [Sulfurimonadaceae bacterium]
MGNNTTYFYTSGLVSLGLFASVLFAFFYMVAYDAKSPVYALNKENYISVSIDLTNASQKKNVKPVDKTIESPKAETIAEMPQEDTKSEPLKEMNIEDMFSNVWTKDIKKDTPKKEEPLDTKRFQEIQKRIKTVPTKETPSLAQKVEAAATKNADENANQNRSSGNEVNEYIAIIHATVYQHFNPPQNSQGHSVEAVIELNAIGKLIDFRILRYSNNALLNEECEKIKNRLTTVLFPKNPNNRSERFTIILTSKE